MAKVRAFSLLPSHSFPPNVRILDIFLGHICYLDTIQTSGDKFNMKIKKRQQQPLLLFYIVLNFVLSVLDHLQTIGMTSFKNLTITFAYLTITFAYLTMPMINN